MNFIEKILNEGFIERGQKELLDMMPHKEKWIPRWWEEYNPSTGWLGIDMDHPDAWFTKEGEDKELILSLQGLLTGMPDRDEDWLLMKNRAVRYICLKVDGKKIYETFSGKIPPDEIITEFLK